MTFKASPLVLFCLAFPPVLQAVPVLTSAGANTWLNAVSADGSTACGATGTANAYSAIRWRSATGSVVLGGGTMTEALALSGDGSVVVGKGNSSGIAAISWSAAGTGTALPHLPVAAAFPSSTAQGISANGAIVVGTSSTTTGVKSVKWINGTPTGLNNTTEMSRATAISGDGTTIVGFRVTGGTNQQAFYKRGDNAIVDLGDLEGGTITSSALGCSTDGTVIVGEGTIPGNKTRGFRWTTTTTMTLLDALPKSISNPDATIESSAFGVSGNGEITVGVSFLNQPATDNGTTPGGGGGPTPATRTETATAWLNNSGEPLSLQSLLAAKGVTTTGWTFQRITGISSSGNVIVGHGTKDAVRQGFIITNALEIFSGAAVHVPKITISRTPDNHPTIQLTTLPGFNYQIERSPDLTSGSWIGYDTISSVGDTGPVLRNITDFSVDLTEADPPKAFYRIRVKAP